MERKVFHVSQEASSFLDVLSVTMVIMWKLREDDGGGEALYLSDGGDGG